MKSSSGDPVCKLILLGNGSVGKSSIIARFVDDGFARQYKQTIGLDFFEKKIHLPHEKRVVLQVWDIGGQNINSKMLDKYIFGADIVFLCYDVTDPKSFADLDDWLDLARKPTPPPPDSNKKQYLYAVGNKIDLVGLRAVSEDAHHAFVATHKLAGGFLLSAHSGDNVLRTVHQIAGRAVGVDLSDFELSFLDKPVAAYALAPSPDENDPRTACADAIEAEDAAHERAKRRQKCTLM
ncbi:Aste57867_21294 [Aphanomyces stellatus]|uniref:Aste57867_21294 protein n=1 Tax=Aphanomyces stellatus TaxID=120398 RepID=A0A485LH36_9STRA|nr:hypothetical protein As57867_021225 [Aphanomyces stellatus]VFT97966.1 Aste57867_21294 [Aphanomyces stellatus]